jgi:hypothetical protein
MRGNSGFSFEPPSDVEEPRDVQLDGTEGSQV